MRTLKIIAALITLGLLFLASGCKLPPSSTRLKTLAESNLDERIYAVISSAGSTIAQKNMILEVVRKAIDTHTKSQKERDAAITDGVSSNGNEEGLALKIIGVVDVVHPIILLKSQTASGLATNIYKIIADAKSSISQKNAIMDAVKSAIGSHAANQASRDDAINKAVSANGNEVGLAAAIITQVDIAHPIGAVLTLQTASGLAANIYNAITGGTSSVPHKNQIIADVNAAILAHPANQGNRDAAINASVLANGNEGGLAAAIIAQVDITHPIPVLTTQIASGLAANIYNAITGGASSVAEKNAIMVDVNAAILAHPANQGNRDAAINASVLANGNEGGLAAAIIAQVDITHPIPVLTTQIASGLAANIYNAITGGASSIVQKNAIMAAVNAAIAAPHDQAERNRAISTAVTANGNEAGLAAAIIAQVNLTHAPVPLACPAGFTDRDIVNALINDLDADINDGGHDWRIRLSVRTPGVPIHNYAVGNPAFNAYVGAVAPPMGAPALAAAPLALDAAANPGGNAVALSAANSAAGQPFERTPNSAISKVRMACRYTVNTMHNANNIFLEVILTR